MKTFAVCIVNYNARGLLRECLRSVISESPGGIIVIDNASTDGSLEMVEEGFPSITIIGIKQNIGYGPAANLAAKYCHTDYLLLLNSDTVLKPGSIKALNDYFMANDKVAIVGPRIVYPGGSPQTSCFHFPTPLHIFLYISNLYLLIRRNPILLKHSLQALPGDAPAIVPWVLGAALAIRRSAFDSVGGFDDTFFMYFEEVDLCFRLAKKGWQIHYAPVTEIIHVGGASTSQLREEMSVEYFASLARFYRKHYSWFRLAQLVLIVQSFAFFRLIRDSILLQITRDKSNRAVLNQDVQIYQRLLPGYWSRQADPGSLE